MKYIIIGLGNFGTTLATTLTKMGHEVIGVDCDMEKVESVKNEITHAVCLDTTKKQSLKSLPFSSADNVIVGIGADQGANILTAAILKQNGVKNIICRAISKLHQTILESMGIDQIVFPEQQEAERLAIKLEFNQVLNTYSLSEEYKIVELELPNWGIQKTIADLSLPSKYNLLVLTLLRETERKNILGIKQKSKDIFGMVRPTTILQDGDVLVVFGKKPDIKRFVEQQ